MPLILRYCLTAHMTFTNVASSPSVKALSYHLDKCTPSLESIVAFRNSKTLSIIIVSHWSPNLETPEAHIYDNAVHDPTLLQNAMSNASSDEQFQKGTKNVKHKNDLVKYLAHLANWRSKRHFARSRIFPYRVSTGRSLASW